MTNPKPNGGERSIVMSFYRAFKSLGTALPTLLGVVLLLGLFLTLVSKQFIASVFTGELLRDTVIGSAMGSIAAGNAVNSYIIGGELMKEGVSLFAITAFPCRQDRLGFFQHKQTASISASTPKMDCNV